MQNLEIIITRSISCLCKANILMGYSKKVLYPSHIRNFHHPERGGGKGGKWSKKSLKFLKNVQIGRGGIVNVLHGGVGLFWNNPIQVSNEMTSS